MGAMNIVGTVASGWICDRFGRRAARLYYGVRGLSLIFLLYVWNVPSLHVFAAIFGLNYISTVPPTTTLTANIFGRLSVGALSGWIFFSHQVGSAIGAWAGGAIFDATGSYAWAFLSAAVLAFIASGLSPPDQGSADQRPPEPAPRPRGAPSRPDKQRLSRDVTDIGELERHRYMSLATFRRSGAEVATPVWFAAADGRLYVFTAEQSGKVKRLRHSSRARVALGCAGASPRRVAEATARIVTEPRAIERARAALSRNTVGRCG